MKKKGLSVLLLSVGLGCMFFGCSAISKTAPKPVIKYAINYSPFPSTTVERLPVILKIDRFGSMPGYASDQMIYAAGPFERSAYVYHRWFSPPAEIVASALVKDLRARKAFSAVTLPGDRIKATHILTGGITDFYEKDDSADWQAVLGISIILFTESTVDREQQILLEKQYTTQTACPGKNAAAFAAAMNTAVQSLADQIFSDSYNAIAAYPTD